MKRNNIYLYEYKDDLRDRNVGFCRMDFLDKRVKILLNIREDVLGIEPGDKVDIVAELLMEGGKKQEFILDNKLIDVPNEEDIVGLSVTYVKKSGIKIKVQGLIEKRKFVEAVEETYVEKQEVSIGFQENKYTKQVELEDTVYNIDMECIEEKRCKEKDKHIEEKVMEEKRNAKKSGIKVKVAGGEKELIKLGLDELVDLPREYWHFAKNKFIICGYNRYGHLAYMKQGEKYIICVPGVLNDKISGCARRFGFKSFFYLDREKEEDDEEKNIAGYWMMCDGR